MTPYDQPDGAREQIHLPGPTLVPFFTAVGIATMLIGLILSWWFVGLGGLIFVLSVVRWVGDVRDEIASLPTERH